MKTGKFLLSGVIATAAAGLAFAVPGEPEVVPVTPIEPQPTVNAPGIVLEAMPWEGATFEHAGNRDSLTYIAIVTAEDTLYLTKEGKGVQEIEDAQKFTVMANEANDEYLIKNADGKYVQWKELTVLDDHKHKKNAVDGTYCCNADKEITASHKEYVIDFATKVPTKHITFTGNVDDRYTLNYDEKSISSAVYEGSEYTEGDAAYKTKFLFDKNEEACVAFVSQDQVDYLNDAKDAIDTYANSRYQGTHLKKILKLAQNKAGRTDWQQLSAELENAIARHNDAVDAFGIELVDSMRNEMTYAITVVRGDVPTVINKLKLDKEDADHFSYQYKTVKSTEALESGAYVDTVKVNVQFVEYTAHSDQGVYNSFIVSNVGDAYVVGPVKGYSESLVVNYENLDPQDGVVFFRPGTKTVQFTTSGFEPKATQPVPSVAIAEDESPLDYSVTKPVLDSIVNEVYYWSVEVTYKPTAVKENYPNDDAASLRIAVHYLDGGIEAATAKVPLHGTEYYITSEPAQVDFPFYGSNGLKELAVVDLSYQKFSGVLLYDYVALETTKNITAVFSDILPTYEETPYITYLQGKGTAEIKISSLPSISGVRNDTVYVVGYRHGQPDVITAIPVTTTNPSLEYSQNVESKNFDLATETLTLGGEVKENYADEVEIIIEDIVNYYDMDDLEITTNNTQFQVTRTTRWITNDPSKCYITINVKYIPCEAHEIVKGQLWIKINNSTEGKIVNLVGVAGDESVVNAVKGASAGINSVSADAAKTVRYNVAGQRVNNAKGIIIENGKKIAQ